MVTVLRAGGLRVVIFVDDHAPAHVHVFGDGEAKINLLAPDDGVELIWAYGMKRGDVKRAVSLVREHRGALLAQWGRIHG